MIHPIFLWTVDGQIGELLQIAYAVQNSFSTRSCHTDIIFHYQFLQYNDMWSVSLCTLATSVPHNHLVYTGSDVTSDTLNHMHVATKKLSYTVM